MKFNFEVKYRLSVYGLSLSCVFFILRTVVHLDIQTHQPKAKLHYIT